MRRMLPLEVQVENLRAMRQLAGLSQIALSRRARVSRMRLQLAEAGELALRPEEDKAVRGVLLSALRKRVNHLQGVLAGDEPLQAEQRIGA